MRGIELFCPLIVTIRQWSDRRKKVKIPMFTSYVFAHIDAKGFGVVRCDTGVLNFVYWQGKPAVIRNEEIEPIKRIASQGTDITVESEHVKIGDEVRIKEGPF